MPRFNYSALTITVCLLALGSQASVLGQVSERANERYRTEEGRATVAQNLDSPSREQDQKPRELVQSLGIKEGHVVADIGTGTGFMLPYLLEAVGGLGLVYAEDIQADFLDSVRRKVADERWSNVRVVQGAVKDASLPPESLDWAFILDVYHHFEYPREVMETVRESLKAQGRLAVIDFYRSRSHPRMAPDRLLSHIRLDRDGFSQEIESAGFRLVRQFDHLPHQYVLIFEKKRD